MCKKKLINATSTRTHNTNTNPLPLKTNFEVFLQLFRIRSQMVDSAFI